jgi:hypothetical protein
MTVIYGDPQFLLLFEREFKTYRKNGWRGEEPRASLDMPVGVVRLAKAGRVRRGRDGGKV